MIIKVVNYIKKLFQLLRSKKVPTKPMMYDYFVGVIARLKKEYIGKVKEELVVTDEELKALGNGWYQYSIKVKLDVVKEKKYLCSHCKKEARQIFTMPWGVNGDAVNFCSIKCSEAYNKIHGQEVYENERQYYADEQAHYEQMWGR